MMSKKLIGSSLVAIGVLMSGTAAAQQALTECEAAFVGTAVDTSGEQASSSSWIDPRVQLGSIQTLILGYRGEGNHRLAADRLRTAPFLTADQANGIHVFKNLPFFTVPSALITPELIEQIQLSTSDLGLATISVDHPLGYALATSGPYIRAPEAREFFDVTGDGIGVAIVDSGIDLTQGDFGFDPASGDLAAGGYNAKFIPGAAQFVETPYGDSSSGHGTHVAGTVFGDGAMSDGQHVGMAPDATQVGFGMGDAIVVFSAMSAFDFMLDPDFIAQHNIRVTNNSYGAISENPQQFNPNSPFEQTIKLAHDAGIVNVFAAGNTGIPPTAPATPDNQISTYAINPCALGVANGDRAGQLNSSSLFGTPDDPTRDPDITAPGTSITAPRALTGAITPPNFDNPFYSTISGTSMATPHVAGAVALMFEAANDAGFDPSFEQIRDAIKLTAVEMKRPDGSTYPSYMVGAGYIDVAAAIAHLLNVDGPERNGGGGPTGDQCVAPGVRFLEDGTGDVNNENLTPSLPVDSQDLISGEVAQYEDNGNVMLQFTLTVVDGAQLIPGSSYFMSFNAPGPSARIVRGVRMFVSDPSAPEFATYVAAGGQAGTFDGRFVTSRAPTNGEFDTEAGEVRFFVDPTELGLDLISADPADRRLDGFNAGVTQSSDPTGDVGAGFTFVSDGMPDDLSRSGALNIKTVQQCLSNTAPAASDASVTTDFETAVSITPAATDADGDNLSFAIVDAPSNGTLSAVNGDEVTYTPNDGYSGSDAFTYKANDGTADSAPATVSITVNAADDVDTDGDGILDKDEKDGCVNDRTRPAAKPPAAATTARWTRSCRSPRVRTTSRSPSMPAPATTRKAAR